MSKPKLPPEQKRTYRTMLNLNGQEMIEYQRKGGAKWVRKQLKGDDNANN